MEEQTNIVINGRSWTGPKKIWDEHFETIVKFLSGSNMYRLNYPEIDVHTTYTEGDMPLHFLEKPHHYTHLKPSIKNVLIVAPKDGGFNVEYMPHERGVFVTSAEYIAHFQDIKEVAFNAKIHGVTAEDTEAAMADLRQQWSDSGS